MLIRSHLVCSLYKNLLGPRDGNTELIEEPFLKYELGILNSSIAATADRKGTQPDIDSEINPNPADVAEESMSHSASAPDAQNPDIFRQEVDTDLSFKVGTVSLGLHFVLEGDSPKFKVCITWARYVQDVKSGNSPRMFKRHPNFFVTKWIDTDAKDHTREELQDGTNGSVVTHPGAHLHVLKRRIDESKWVVRIFLENRTKYGKTQKEKERIFQPQIRVISDGKSHLLDLDSEYGRGGDKRHEKEDLLYRRTRVKARGHMCAAVWDEVDPGMKPNEDIGEVLWPDSQSVPEAVREEFSRPLVRTEYLPMYTVLQPAQSEKSTFDASEISQTWDPLQIEHKMAPIVDGFSEWIGLQKESLKSQDIHNDLKSLGEESLRVCDKTRSRIRAGIDFLKTSERARAAFCFMNAVMNDKWCNEGEEGNLRWRKFQMAFILQSLRGVSGESEDERKLADVLWFPTGGGKTEAYLGIVIFAIAYRRLTLGDGQSNDGGVAVISRYTLRLLTIQQFQRALGAIVAADVRRVKNWLPAGAIKGNQKISDQYMQERWNKNSLWGDHRFSIGMWIGNENTPKNFAHRTVTKGKVLLNCEGALLPTWSEVAKRSDGNDAEPAQIQTCPCCGNILRLPEGQSADEPVRMTWVIRSPKSFEDLMATPRQELRDYHVEVISDPSVEMLGNAPDGMRFYRLTLEIKPRTKRQHLSRKSVDTWWKTMVHPKLDPNPDSTPLESTSPSMPGYFFLQRSGSGRPHDFAIFCTDSQCRLNQTEWFETIGGSHNALVPEAFQMDEGHSKSVPISAYTADEQIYLKCPSMLIATVDKFANLPFEPKCSSIFGNVDVVHSIYGYGRRSTFESPLWLRSKREKVRPEELHGFAGFSPPSLILQDELHLIEGPLGSMVGVYEMAVDTLSDNGFKPKYIASSATIREAESQVGTIFRRKIATFPPSGIDASDNYFSKLVGDVTCAKNSPGRLYLGMATTKSTVTLPIKAQSIVMSEIHKIRSNPDGYGLTQEEKSNLLGEVDPYWTFVSYFTDLQLLSKFNNYYSENITENVNEWSREKVYNSESRERISKMSPGLRLFTLKADRDMRAGGISVYCAEGKGRIGLAVYRDGDPVGRCECKFALQECKPGENEFVMAERPHVKEGERIWIAVMHDSPDVAFQTVASGDRSLEIPNTGASVPNGFPDECAGTRPYEGDTIRLSLNSPARKMESHDNIVLSSETKSEDLAGNLERLKNAYDVDSLQTSPVFGTGIDVDRLGMMEVMNQPKTNSGYIQSTGRVGRTKPGLVINWLRAGRARDLNHYENFIGYHMSLNRFVEPVTASPFSPTAMHRCLGPVMVSILRNAKSVRGTGINPDWVGSNGPYRMSRHHDAEDVRAVGKALEEIATSGFVAEFRRMRPDEFKRIFEQVKASWHRLASEMELGKKPEFQYAERNPKKPPSSNVVLGTPNHEDRDLLYAYGNTPVSLRQTESTAAFYNANELAPIRPSQFTTRYGPGSLVTGKATTWVIPSVEEIVGCLRDRDGFERGNHIHRGRKEITDLRMKRILHRLNPDIPWDKLKLFALPSNSSLEIADLEGVYRCKDLSSWAICYNSRHPSKVLAKVQRNNKGELVVKCPECQRVAGIQGSINFYGVRFVMACKKGHLGDVDWVYEVHRGNDGSRCEGDVFEWKVLGGNDDARISCMGHWKGDRFVRSRCGKSVSYIGLKARSKEGEMRCGAKFAEGKDSSGECEEKNGKSQAKMVSKMQMSLRMPIVATTMEIQRYKGTLFQYYEPLAQAIDTYIDTTGKSNKEDILEFFKNQKERSKEGYTSKLIDLTSDASESDFSETIDEIQKIAAGGNRSHTHWTELHSLEEELSSLVSQTRDRGTGAQITPTDLPSDHRFPITFSAMGIGFEAMPFGDIKVTQVQTGYTREITPPAVQDIQEEQGYALRIGDPVRFSAMLTDTDKNKWYVANQLAGEGIFIHLDSKTHEDGTDVLRRGPGSAQTWMRIHENTRRRNEHACKILKHERGNEQRVDDLEMATVLTNPLFVWWHSFAHELINQLAIDSGFMGASLGERVYCVTKGSGRNDAGILIYAASPGADGTLGGLISLVDKEVLPKIIEKTLRKICSCSNDPLCSDMTINDKRSTGAACHACLMNSETSCAYQNKFLDRNVVSEALDN